MSPALAKFEKMSKTPQLDAARRNFAALVWF
jgi:hypothetical protein